MYSVVATRVRRKKKPAVIKNDPAVDHADFCASKDQFELETASESDENYCTLPDKKDTEKDNRRKSSKVKVKITVTSDKSSPVPILIQSPSRARTKPKYEKLPIRVIHSPLLEIGDTKLDGKPRKRSLILPLNNKKGRNNLLTLDASDPVNSLHSDLTTHEKRWNFQSSLAGTHKQDPTVLDLSHRFMSPEALKFGVPPKVAANVTDFRFDKSGLDLPSVLDMVGRLFPNLEHLHLVSKDSRTIKKPDISPKNEGVEFVLNEDDKGRMLDSGKISREEVRNEDSTDKIMLPKVEIEASLALVEQESIRMERLYILYRLPDLISINGKLVTDEERGLARPLSPAGYKVKKKDWLTKAMASNKKDDTEENSDAVEYFCSEEDIEGDDEEDTGKSIRDCASAVEVSLNGMIHMVKRGGISSESVSSIREERQKLSGTLSASGNSLSEKIVPHIIPVHSGSGMSLGIEVSSLPLVSDNAENLDNGKHGEDDILEQDTIVAKQTPDDSTGELSRHLSSDVNPACTDPPENDSADLIITKSYELVFKGEYDDASRVSLPASTGISSSQPSLKTLGIFPRTAKSIAGRSSTQHQSNMQLISDKSLEKKSETEQQINIIHKSNLSDVFSSVDESIETEFKMECTMENQKYSINCKTPANSPLRDAKDHFISDNEMSNIMERQKDEEQNTDPTIASQIFDHEYFRLPSKVSSDDGRDDDVPDGTLSISSVCANIEDPAEFENPHRMEKPSQSGRGKLSSPKKNLDSFLAQNKSQSMSGRNSPAATSEASDAAIAGNVVSRCLSRSLSSPFPMQFRDDSSQAGAVVQILDPTKLVTQKVNATAKDEIPIEPSTVPDTRPDAKKNVDVPQDVKKDEEKSKSKSSGVPSHVNVRLKKSRKKKGSRPPPSPASIIRTFPPPRQKQMKRKPLVSSMCAQTGHKWKDSKLSKSISMMDQFEDDSDDEDESEDEENERVTASICEREVDESSNDVIVNGSHDD